MKYYGLTDKGQIKDYCGTHFEYDIDDLIELTQPWMIDKVLKIVGLFPENKKAKTTR